MGVNGTAASYGELYVMVCELSGIRTVCECPKDAEWVRRDACVPRSSPILWQNTAGAKVRCRVEDKKSVRTQGPYGTAQNCELMHSPRPAARRHVTLPGSIVIR